MLKPAGDLAWEWRLSPTFYPSRVPAISHNAHCLWARVINLGEYREESKVLLMVR